MQPLEEGSCCIWTVARKGLTLSTPPLCRLARGPCSLSGELCCRVYKATSIPWLGGPVVLKWQFPFSWLLGQAMDIFEASGMHITQDCPPPGVARGLVQSCSTYTASSCVVYPNVHSGIENCGQLCLLHERVVGSSPQRLYGERPHFPQDPGSHLRSERGE